MLSDITYVVLAVAFYRLLAPVGRASATLIVIFAAAGAGVGLVHAGAKLDVLTLLGAAGYAFNFFGKVLWAGYATTSLPMILPIPAHVGEIGLMLWLVIVGTTLRKGSGPGTPEAPWHATES